MSRERRRRTTRTNFGTLWPEFLALSEELHAHLNELTERVIREAITEDVSEVTEQVAPKALPETAGR
jgi:Na+-translocating ferredoxin:NAD+ oxidoreductase RnfG subunit